MVLGIAAQYALVLVVALPLAGALVVAAAGARRPDLGAAVGPRIGAAAFVLALVVAVAVAAGEVVAVRAGGGTGPGLVADALGVALLLLVCGVNAVAQGFARRYLHGDEGAGRFSVAAGLLAGATAALVTAATLVGLAVAWTAAGVALCLLLRVHPRSPAARVGVRRTARAVLIGDAALWVAVGLVVLGRGDVDLRRLPADLPPAVLAVAAGLVVVAALARSAQVPFHGWLPVTLAAPTPVSALLHAGVVNAGGILLVRTGGLVGAAPLAMHLAFAAGAVTAVYGTALMLARPDVKGALVHSTVGQMGFMIMACGLGWYAAAVVHLLAHGMYKAALFLGSGSAVDRHVRHRATAPPAPVARRTRAAAVAFSVAAPAAAVVAAAAALDVELAGASGTGPLLVFAWATAARLTWGWLRRQPTVRGGAGALVALAVLLPGYVALVDAVAAAVAPSLPGPAPGAAAPWLLVVVVAAMAGLAAVRHLPAHPRLGGLHRALYVRALVGAHPAPPRPPRPPVGVPARPARPALVPSSGGARP
jgi:NADH:ubiquinone oxidoreductase subunit 5 (subunit L)/multisubunit Na+/H+ antiporter MnhA subunit